MLRFTAFKLLVYIYIYIYIYIYWRSLEKLLFDPRWQKMGKHAFIIWFHIYQWFDKSGCRYLS